MLRNKLKKALALATVTVMTAAFAISAGAAGYTDSEQITPQYSKAVSFVRSLSIMIGNNDKFRPESGLRRSELAKMAWVIYNKGNDDQAAAFKGIDIFEDVKADDWHIGYVNALAAMDVIAGFNNKFNPDREVTGYEALKVVLGILGYESRFESYTDADKVAGKPNVWYYNVYNDAKNAGLLEGLLNADFSKALTREEAAQIMYNAMNAKTVSYNTTTTVPVRSEGANGLAYYYNAYEITGTLVATPVFALDNAYAKDGKSTLLFDLDGDGTATDLLYINDTMALGQIGQNFSILVSLDKGTAITGGKAYEIVKAYNELSADGSSVVVKTDDFNGKDLEVYIDETLELEAEDSIAYIQNYTLPAVTKDAVMQNGDTVRFVDTDANGKIDYVLVETAQYAKISEIDKDGKVTAKQVKDDTTKALNAVEAEKILTSGTLQKDDRVMVMPIANGNYVVTKLSPVSTSLTALSGNDLTIGGAVYKVSGIAGAMVKNDFTASSNFNAEMYYFTVGAYVLEAAQPETVVVEATDFAIIIDSYMSAQVGSEGDINYTPASAKVKIFTSDGRTLICDLEAIDNTKLADLTENAGKVDEAQLAATGTIYSYELNGNSVSLKTENETPAANAATFTKGDFTYGGKYVDSDSIFFVKAGDNYYCFNGKQLPSIKNSPSLSMLTYGDAIGGTNNHVRYAYIEMTAASLDINPTITTHAMIVSKPVIGYDSTEKKFFASFDLFDGNAKTNVVMAAGESSSSDLLTLDNLGLSCFDFVSYEINSDGKLVNVRTLSAASDLDTDSAGWQTAYLGAISGDVAYFGKSAGTAATTPLAIISGDAKITLISDKTKTGEYTVGSIEDLKDITRAEAVKVIVKVEEGKITNLFAFTGETTVDLT